ncbi:MAG: hypothetical protein KAX28_01375 [Candidatus Marinimicrobia bacterium]|nr:hypothetical protein [Candidatus Neomarinimicrobiota bacterium]
MLYKAQQFSNVANTKLGNDIWNFLNQKENIIRMETASELRHPALESVAGRLLKKFGEAIKNDRIKQMTGHMVRQIMESKGFHLDAQNVKVRFGGLFTKASRYCRNAK